MKPTLTKPRWRALKKLEAIGDKPFAGMEVGVKGQTLVSLEICGWVKRVNAPKNDTPFSIKTHARHWRVTEAGLEAINAINTNPPKWS